MVQLPPVATGDWYGPTISNTCPWIADAPNADSTMCALYERPGHPSVFVSIVSVARERPGKELIGGDAVQQFRIWSRMAPAITVSNAPGVRSALAWTAIDRAGTQWRQWSWYSVDDYTTHSTLSAKVAEAFSFSRGRPTTVFQLGAACYEPCTSADEYLRGFMQAHPDVGLAARYGPTASNAGGTEMSS